MDWELWSTGLTCKLACEIFITWFWIRELESSYLRLPLGRRRRSCVDFMRFSEHFGNLLKAEKSDERGRLTTNCPKCYRSEQTSAAATDSVRFHFIFVKIKTAISPQLETCLCCIMSSFAYKISFQGHDLHYHGNYCTHTPQLNESALDAGCITASNLSDRLSSVFTL